VIYVFTSILSGWDNLRPPAISNAPGARFICFTDLPVLPKVEPWEYRPLHPAGPAARTARVPKILPHLMLPDDARYSIYMDGNLQLKVEPQAVIDSLLAGKDWAAHRHPCRDCIYDEARVLVNERIGTTALVQAEIDLYRREGHPEHAGLWANGFLVRRHTPQVAALNEAWWKLYAAGCERDQLSFPVARRAAGLEVATINANIYESRYLNFYFHAAWKDQPSNLEYQSERAVVRRKLDQIYALTGSVSTYPNY
jgi:hypothetical protein